MLSFDAYLFDFDGTLVDTLEDIAAAAERTLEAAGFGKRPFHTLEEYRRFVGYGARELIVRASRGLAPESEADRLLAMYKADYREHLTDHSRFYDGVLPMLCALRAAGKKLLLVTNKPEEQARGVLEILLQEPMFDGIFGGGAGKPIKPDARCAGMALASVGITPEKALFVGDSDVDVYTAHNAGIACAGVSWGFRGEEELRAAGAEYIVHQAEEILAL